MRSIALLLTLGLFALPRTAAAIVVEVPLPELAGTYGELSAGGSRVCTFHLPGLPALVRGVSLHVRGTTEVGVLMCDGQDGIVRPQPWMTEIDGRMTDTPGRDWWAWTNLPVEGAPPVAGGFDWTGAFRSYDGGTWGFLNDGEGTMELLGGATAYVLSCTPGSWPPPRVFVEEATLIVDADFAVPAPVTTWGRIKAAYR
jgi:hypothetical protein